ncbi:uncharacterized protein LOC144064294 [Stigmatopora argus]
MFVFQLSPLRQHGEDFQKYHWIVGCSSQTGWIGRVLQPMAVNEEILRLHDAHLRGEKWRPLSGRLSVKRKADGLGDGRTNGRMEGLTDRGVAEKDLFSLHLTKTPPKEKPLTL